jgi:hypothetical protein
MPSSLWMRLLTVERLGDFRDCVTLSSSFIIHGRLASVVYAMAGGIFFLLLRAITPWQGWRVHVTAIKID